MISNFFHSQATALFKPPRSVRFKVQHAFELTMTVVALARFVNLLIAVFWGRPFAEKVLGLPAAQIAWDPYPQFFFNHRHHFRLLFFTAFLFLLLQAVLVNYAIYFQAGSRPISGGGYYELAGLNFEAVARAICKDPSSQRDPFSKGRQKKKSAAPLQQSTSFLPAFLGRLLHSFLPLDLLLQRLSYYWAFYRGELVDLRRLRRDSGAPPLKVYGSLSPAVRRRLFLISLLFDLFFFGFGRAVLIINLQLTVLYQSQMILANTTLGSSSRKDVFSPFSMLFFALDLLLINLMLWIVFRDTMLMIHYINLTAEAYRGHLAEVNQVLAGFAARVGGKLLVVKNRRSSSSFFSPPLPPPPLKIWQRRQLELVLAEHTRASMRIAVINADFSSSLSLILLSLHIAINIIWAHQLIMVDHFQLFNPAFVFWPFEGAYLLFVIVAQIVVIAIMLLPFGRVNAEIYRTAKYLPAIVNRLDGGQGELALVRSADIALKFRLAEMCDRLGCAERRIGFCLGPRRVITYNILFKTLLLHVGYLVCFFNFINTNKREESV